MERWRAILELVDREWVQLTSEEKDLFRQWTLHAHGEDLYMLLHHAKQKWSRRQSSSSQTFAAIKDTEDPNAA